MSEHDDVNLDDNGDELEATPYQPTWWWDCPRCREVNETQTDALDRIEECRECSAKVQMRS